MRKRGEEANLVADVPHGADPDGGDLDVLHALPYPPPHPHRQEDPHHLLAHDPHERGPAPLTQRDVEVHIQRVRPRRHVGDEGRARERSVRPERRRSTQCPGG
jgi:hypothetical protein